MTTETPLVSIAMPFYNCEATLPAAIGSLLAQTYTNWELLACDDGSSDQSLLSVMSHRDPRIKIWSDRQRKGLATRLNECIERARGTYIARMDADDITYPERFEKQVLFLEQHSDVDLAGSHMPIFSDDGAALGKRVLPSAHDSIVANPAISFGIGHPTWMGRANWFRRHRYNPQAVRFEDIELLQRSYRQSRFANLPEVLNGYREGAGGLSKRLKTRMERVRFMWRSGTEGAYQSALVEPFKAVCDAVVVGTGLRYAMLKAREQALTPAEAERWHMLFDQFSARGAQHA